MTAPVEMTVTPIVGDGTSTGQRAARRWRAWRWGLGVVSLLVVVGLLAALPEPPVTGDPLDANNPGKYGGQAAARVLSSHGVDVVIPRSVPDAISEATPGTTILVTNDSYLMPDQVTALASTSADIVMVGPMTMLNEVAPNIVQTSWGSNAPSTRPSPECSDPDALAAGSVYLGEAGYQASGGINSGDAAPQVCFPDASGAGAYVVTEQNGRRVTVLADGNLLANNTITEEGNAALVLRALGRTPTLIWLTPTIENVSLTGDGGDSGPGLRDLLPHWTFAFIALGLAIAIAAALWRMRRLGPIVVEPLPVVVPAGETTRGRGRLYRRHHTHAHAAAALRAGAAARSAKRLGLERSASATTVVAAIASATSTDETVITDLLYGPPPTNDAALVRLASRLDHMERQVHRS